MNIAKQIADVAQRYVDSVPMPANEEEHRAAMLGAVLSGISLTADFLAGNDGHPDVSPQAMAKAVGEVATLMGFKASRVRETPSEL